jgi:streptogramin lyase
VSSPGLFPRLQSGYRPPARAGGFGRRGRDITGEGGKTMIRISAAATAFAGIVGAAALALPAASAAELKVLSDKAVQGVKWTESVAYDPGEKVFYASEFGSKLDTTLKDGAGRISKISLDGKILQEGVFPANGEKLNKPKGVWIARGKLWVTDIDVVWEFDLKTKQSRKVDLPGAKFANDPTVMNGALYVSDNRGDQLFRVEPADFLKGKKEPKITTVFTGKSVNPNGVYPGKGGTLLMVGFAGKDTPRGIFSMAKGKDPKEISKNIGMLDGLYQMKDGSLLVTDWVSGTLFHWSEKGGMQTLASNFKGPADFGVAPNKQGLLVVVPDLPKSELRFIQLGK